QCDGVNANVQYVPGVGTLLSVYQPWASELSSLLSAYVPEMPSKPIDAAVAPLIPDTGTATGAAISGALHAALDSPALTGTPTAPTPAVGDSSGSIATTAFVGAAFMHWTAPTALNPWFAALANREHEKACAVFYGTSMTEGGPMITTSRLDRWLDRLAFDLHAKFPLRAPVPGSSGYIPSFYVSFPKGGSTQFGLTVPTGATIPRALAVAGPGIGARSLEIAQAGDYMQFAFIGTGFDFLYNSRDVASSAATITVDNGAAVALPVPSATNTQATYQGRGLTAGSHTVRVDWTAGHVDIQGVYPYNGDEANGIHIWDAGKGSAKVSDGFTGTGAYWALSNIQPALVGFEFGYNEYFGGIAPATFAANLATAVSNALAQITTPPSVLFLVWPRGGGADTYTYDYQAYVDAIYAQAASTANAVVVDFSERLPSPRVNNALGFFGVDTTHPADKGGAYIADTILAVLSPH
ncbi:MAG TPA: SGNH/GDSL hydrolase family protein, partial [Nitrospira sp.]|nr:SGNH/GDSL hydrolase family protein [Nitrospira sp.]